MSANSESKHSPCKEYAQCLEYLHLMLDNEATKEQKTFLMDHIDKCMVCFEQYEVEKQLRLLIKTGVTSQPVPVDLANQIKNKVFQSA